MARRDCSEQTAREIDLEVKRILDGAYAESKALLDSHRIELVNIVRELLRRETMDGQTFKQFITPAPQSASSAAAHRTA